MDFKSIEISLIEAKNRTEAEDILKDIPTDELKQLQKELCAFSAKKGRKDMIKAIVNHTYEAVRRSQIIREMR